MDLAQEEVSQQGLFVTIERLERELKEKERQLDLVNQVGGMLNSELELDKVVQKVINIATKISKAEFGAFFYNKTDKNGEVYELYALAGAKQEDFGRFPMPRKTAVFTPTFRGEGILRSENITLDPRYGQNRPHHGMPRGHLPVKSYMAVPVISKSGKVLGGALFGHSEPGVFTQNEEVLVQNIASQAAIAIDNAYLHEAKLEAEQRKSREQINTILESITDGFFTIGHNWEVTYWNQEAERITGRKRGELLMRDIREAFGDQRLHSLYRKLHVAVSRHQPVSFTSYYSLFNAWLTISAYPSEDGLSVYFKDITKQRHAEELEHLGKKVLELNTRSDSKLEDIVTYYLKGLERIHPDMLCSVMLLENAKLNILSAPSLPAFYVQAINGLAVEPEVGCCGAAAFTGKPVFSQSIAHDPKWANYRQTALDANLKACWSSPIFSSTQRVLGTFGIYYQEMREPTPGEIHSVESSRNLLQMLLEHKAIENALRQSNQRYNLATSATNDAIWEWEITTNKVYSGAVYEKVFGYEFQEYEIVEDRHGRIHPEDRERVLRSFEEALEDPAAHLWQMEYRYMRKNGTFTYVLDRAHIVRDEQQQAVRMVGAMRDISGTKEYELERELLIEELKQNNSDLKQFSYITSHNLRAPLANLLGIIRLLNPEAISDDMNRTLVHKFKEATLKLSSTLEDLLDVLLIRNHSGLKAEQVSIGNSLQKVLLSVDDQIRESNATVRTDFSAGETVYANPSYLYSILLNLFSNALKYRSPERLLQIQLTTKATAGFIELRFSDNGLGIDLRRFGERIFGLYQRFHKYENSKGMGLFMTQAQVKAMGGSIAVESNVGEGTTFIIQLRKQPV
ncbi:PAS domain S-box protein [Rufibacter immobilis]|uniref:histidine kinase n=1 Tax=Rufibacter immobilis TaxID=1348778 RepID=A0A3M9MZT4_9BACT|nr:GAF domain-containing protein [Rufibacter immobilis]RNI30278.1 PAS domain S-box protein [Rufibacter immobilis]